VVDDYVVYLLGQLRSNGEEIIVVANGEMNEEGKGKLKPLIDRLAVRENVGFDAGAYKYVMRDIGEGTLKTYDEIVLCNDTFYGFFADLDSIFLEMRNRSVDFWGMSCYNNNIYRHIQSYFLVFGKTIMEDGSLFRYFESKINVNESNISNIYLNFETGLFEYLIGHHYRFGSYNGLVIHNMYKAGNYAIKNNELCIMKKRCFSNQKFYKDNVYDAIQYIHHNKGYDIDLIIKNARRVYGFEDTMEEVLRYPCNNTVAHRFPVYITTEEDVINFLTNHRTIYIYGAGYMAKYMWNKHKSAIRGFRGFIISDNQELKEKQYDGYRIYKRSEIKYGGDEAILIAVGKEAYAEIMDDLDEFGNKLCIS
jgi:hypothetical protein